MLSLCFASSLLISNPAGAASDTAVRPAPACHGALLEESALLKVTSTQSVEGQHSVFHEFTHF